MRSTKTAIAAFIALTALAACARGDDETADTTTIPGVDTTAGMAMPTTDTIVKTTETDTIQGEVPRDSVNAKKGAKTKTPY
jgi:predicted outer membrane protein